MTQTHEAYRVVDTAELRKGLADITRAVNRNTEKTTLLRRDVGEHLNTFADAVIAEIREAAREIAQETLAAARAQPAPEALSSPAPKSLSSADEETIVQARAAIAEAQRREKDAEDRISETEEARIETERMRDEATAVLTGAEEEAAKVLSQARVKAEETLAAARGEAERIMKASEKRARESEDARRQEHRNAVEHSKKIGETIVSQMRAQAAEEIARSKQEIEKERGPINMVQTPAEARLMESLKRFAERNGEDIVRSGIDPEEMTEEEGIDALLNILDRLSPPANPFANKTEKKSQRFENAYRLGNVKVGS